MTIKEAMEQLSIDKLCILAISSHPEQVNVTEFTVAIEALKKQIPAKPIKESKADWLCLSCGNYIPFDVLNEKIEDAPSYCEHCGQALDWRLDNG